MGYQSIQFAPDGDYITDYHCDTVEEVWDLVSDQGSRWFFYPLPFVITDSKGPIPRKRIVSSPEGFEYLTGLTVKTAEEEIRNNPEYVAAILS